MNVFSWKKCMCIIALGYCRLCLNIRLLVFINIFWHVGVYWQLLTCQCLLNLLMCWSILTFMELLLMFLLKIFFSFLYTQTVKLLLSTAIGCIEYLLINCLLCICFAIKAWDHKMVNYVHAFNIVSVECILNVNS